MIDNSNSDSINNNSNIYGSSIYGNPLIKLGVVSSAVTDLVHGYDTLLETLPSVAEKVNMMSIGMLILLLLPLLPLLPLLLLLLSLLL